MAKKYSGGGGSSVTISGDADNRVLTADGSSGLVGEPKFTYNASSEELTLGSGVDLIMTDNAGYFLARRLKIVAVTGNTTLSASSHAGYYVMVAGSGLVITLPDNQTGGTHFTIIANGANSFTLRTGSGAGNGDNMNGSQADITVAAYTAVTAISNATDYIVLGV